MAKRRWSDLTGGQRVATIVGSAVQFALAAAAWSDLANRPAKLVNGKKAVWALVIAVNFVGPISYFLLGRRTHR